jgi:hypothetical protein
MRLIGLISTAVLSLALGVAAPAFAQEQHEQEEQKAKPAAQEERKAQPQKSAKQEGKPSAQHGKNAKPQEKNVKANKNTKPEEKNAKQADKSVKPAEKNVQQQRQRAGSNGGGRIPEARFQANFGRQHTFHVSQADYSNHRFQYGGYWFGFADPWPSNWLYTQDLFVVDINGVYYLCNANYPGVNIALNFTL